MKLLTIPFLKPYRHPRHAVKKGGDVIVRTGPVWLYGEHVLHLGNLLYSHTFEKNLIHYYNVQGALFQNCEINGPWAAVQVPGPGQ